MCARARAYLALAAARAGAASVIAIDINPNARPVGGRERTRKWPRGSCHGAGLESPLRALAPRPLFDVILSRPALLSRPSRLDLADRAWHAGPNYRDIAALFDQACEDSLLAAAFTSSLSSDSDVKLLGALIKRARVPSARR